MYLSFLRHNCLDQDTDPPPRWRTRYSYRWHHFPSDPFGTLGTSTKDTIDKVNVQVSTSRRTAKIMDDWDPFRPQWGWECTCSTYGALVQKSWNTQMTQTRLMGNNLKENLTYGVPEPYITTLHYPHSPAKNTRYTVCASQHMINFLPHPTGASICLVPSLPSFLVGKTRDVAAVCMDNQEKSKAIIRTGTKCSYVRSTYRSQLPLHWQLWPGHVQTALLMWAVWGAQRMWTQSARSSDLDHC